MAASPKDVLAGKKPGTVGVPVSKAAPFFADSVQRYNPGTSGERNRGGIVSPQAEQAKKEIMTEDMYYLMNRERMGSAVIINNLDKEQPPTLKDVKVMADVLIAMKFDVEIHKNLDSKGMNSLKKKITEEKYHKDANCFLLLIICHGTADNFLLDKDGGKVWNIESLLTEICDVDALVGKPKLFFIEACRGKDMNFGKPYMSKATRVPESPGIILPSKQDLFVGFATVPGFVSLTINEGSPYLQALAKMLKDHHHNKHLSDIHLLVKRELAGKKMGPEQVSQGAEERSSLLSQLLFSKYNGHHQGGMKKDGFCINMSSLNIWTSSPWRSSETTRPSNLGSSTSPVSTTTATVVGGTSSLQSRPSSMIGTSSNPSPWLTSSQPRSLAATSYSTSSGISARPLLTTRPLSSALSTGTSSPFSAFTSTTKTTSAFSGFTASSVTTTSSASTRPIVRSATGTQLNGHPTLDKDSNRPSSAIFPISTSARSHQEQISNTHTVEITNEDVEGGLNLLLKKVKELYGGEGKVKVKNKKKDKVYSIKYKGPERATGLLQSALQGVRDLQSKGNRWKFTQKVEVITQSHS